MRIFNEPLLAAPAPNNTSFNSLPMKLDQMFGYAIQIVQTGTPSGTLKLQGCADSVQNSSPNKGLPVNWSDISGSSVSVSSSGNTLYNSTDVMYNFVRVVYTDSSGGTATGTSSINSNGKGV
jgi:hypothetical protein